MDPQQRQKISKSLDSGLVFVWGITLLLFPFVLTNLTTEYFSIPKQLFLSGVVLISIVLFGARMALSQQVRFRRTPLDVPVILFGLALLVSSLVSVNKADSLIAFTPIFLAILGYFLITNVLRKQDQVVFALTSVVASGAGLAILAIFSYLKVYPIPLAATHIQSFTPLGSLVEQAVYIVAILPIAIYFGKQITKGDTTPKTVGFAAATLLMGAGLLVTVAQLLTTQKPVLLPFETGFQTAFASISQDTGRVAQGFFFGSGYGTFDTVFTRFKQASFNTSPVWFLQFTSSSSFVLELLATTGIVGLLSFFLLLFRSLIHPNKKLLNPLYFSLIILTVACFVIPFSFFSLSFFLLVIGLFSCYEALKHPSQFYDIEPRFVAVKKGFISFSPVTVSEQKVEDSKFMPYGITAFMLVFVGIVGVFGVKFALGNMHMQKSITAANNNNGSVAYSEQVNALNIFPYQSSYYRIFSQTNIALATSIANSQPKGSSPSAQVQSTVYTLIQQGINTARTATNISPLSVGNWQNLASVYRALIGFGQGADNFAIQSTQQAILLDPTNPQEFLNIGGLYFQLGQYDNAIRMFQQAISLKQDYSNAYYNLAHAYLQKNDTSDALQALLVVQQLTVNDRANHDKVTKEIADIQSKQGSQTPTPTPNQSGSTPSSQTPPATVQEPLNVNGQPTTIPAQTSPVPLISPTPSPKQ